jgi:hypothetical protein
VLPSCLDGRAKDKNYPLIRITKTLSRLGHGSVVLNFGWVLTYITLDS